LLTLAEDGGGEGQGGGEEEGWGVHLENCAWPLGLV
jgi:hypothetical protein